MFGAKLTLIVLTSQRLARIDLAGPRRHLHVERVLSCPTMATSELAASVAIAFRQGETNRRPGSSSKPVHHGARSLIVLSDDIWNETITLPLDVTVLLRPAEIQQALALEAENFSGINAFDSRFASRQLVDTSTNLFDTSTNFANATSWWVAQLANKDLASMTASAQACSARFLGATHWLAPWRAGLLTSTVPAIDLDTPAAWMEFGQRWSEVLSHDYDLLIQPAAGDKQSQRMNWIQTSAAVATLLACTGVYLTRTAQLETAEAQQSRLQKMLSDQETLASKVQAATTKLQQMRQKTPSSELAKTQLITVTPQTTAGVDSSQWLALFDALAMHTPDDCWVESWRTQEDQAILSGRAVSAQAIHQMASRLEHALQNSDWQVLPPVIVENESQLLQFDLAINVERSTKPERLRSTLVPTERPKLVSHSSPQSAGDGP